MCIRDRCWHPRPASPTSTTEVETVHPLVVATRGVVLVCLPLEGTLPRRPSHRRDETHLKCSRGGARASRENCSRNLGPASGAAVCLGDGSTVVDGDTS